MQETSLSLLQRLATDRNDSDWQRLIAIYRPFMFQRIATYPALIDQAEDIVQEVLMVLLRELPVFQRQRTGSFRTWLRGIVLNQLRAAARRRKRQPLAAGQHDKLLGLIDQLADPNSIATNEFDRQHDKAVFSHAAEIVKNEFNETTWKAFCRHAINGHPAQEVADELGISKNVVLLAKSRITRRIREEVRGMVDS